MTWADIATEGELLVYGERHEPQHAFGHRHVEVGPPARCAAPGEGRRDGERRISGSL